MVSMARGLKEACAYGCVCWWERVIAYQRTCFSSKLWACTCICFLNMSHIWACARVFVPSVVQSMACTCLFVCALNFHMPVGLSKWLSHLAYRVAWCLIPLVPHETIRDMNSFTGSLLWNPNDAILSGRFSLCMKVVPFLDRHYTGPIVFYTDMNAYLTILFICDSGWVMTMNSYNGWQSSEAGGRNIQDSRTVFLTYWINVLFRN